MAKTLHQLLDALMEAGHVEVVGDRALARAVFVAARQAVDGTDALLRGHEADDFGTPVFSITYEPPTCTGGCGGRPWSPAGMCYECECNAHAAGWYDQDTGYARVGGF